MVDLAEQRRGFRELHQSGTFVLPNAWDQGSARLLAQLGFPAVATTSSGLAASLGRADQQLHRDQLIEHVAALSSTVEIQVAVDAERGYAPDPDGVAATVELLAQAGASGVSIEDYDPVTGQIDRVEVAVERIAAAAAVCDRHGMVLTGRAENHLYGVADLADTIARLRAYRAAGAACVYAPGLGELAEITRVADEVDAPLNVLALRQGPAVPELARAGVRRVSTGGALAWAAYGALVRAAGELRDTGTSTFLDHALAPTLRDAAFPPEPLA
ncbi:isocitrate lyase/phosphoenolpyruvate mutase family protein [Natronosporangium hydrolyticum]|uniref:Isocitrate lyase/phosphoenolpyruvate mutase family protein n=1 Tax=Natronosporangium hydrolyticum TaxID=2811111 RepID=A0A895YKV0_9ACTN|nr:isocitrate lyase/phosphoenolpyruvate mutase family protein [Natronosporangium hydrolyticum]QSB15286.1 isocitrate lyase/phosphoenolpyruvate mutase family protein [Natronosporangium hydrolyticum]